MTLLGPTDAAPFRLINKAGRSRFLLLGDHAGNLVPAKLVRPGLGDAELSRHIGLDIGVSALGGGWRSCSTPVSSSSAIR